MSQKYKKQLQKHLKRLQLASNETESVLHLFRLAIHFDQWEFRVYGPNGTFSRTEDYLRWLLESLSPHRPAVRRVFIELVRDFSQSDDRTAFTEILNDYLSKTEIVSDSPQPLTHRQTALLYIYLNISIVEYNAQRIAESRGQKSGKRLLETFKELYNKPSLRTGEHRFAKRDLLKVIEVLTKEYPDRPDAMSAANDALDRV